jgi:hypothetical protein
VDLVARRQNWNGYSEVMSGMVMNVISSASNTDRGKTLWSECQQRLTFDSDKRH